MRGNAVRNHSRCRTCLVVAGVLLLSVVCGCSKQGEETSRHQKLKVVTTLFPLYDFGRQVGGDRADVTLLLPPGVEPHSFEPKPGDILKVENADLFIYTGKQMEPWAETVLNSIGSKRLVVVDDSAGILKGEEKKPYTFDKRHARETDEWHYHGDIDPHVWLDFSNAQKMVLTIAGGFVLKDPSRREYYERNAQQYNKKLQALDEEYRRVLEGCSKHVIIHGGHFAFNYLAKRYGLRYISAYSGSPDAEPTARKLIEIKQQMKKYGVHYIYYEELITPRVAEIIARETGASMLKLNGAHNVTRDEMARGVTFIDIMQQNLNSLRVGLECR